VKFAHVLFEICEQTDKQTDTKTMITIPRPPIGAEVMKSQFTHHMITMQRHTRTRRSQYSQECKHPRRQRFRDS